MYVAFVDWKRKLFALPLKGEFEICQPKCMIMPNWVFSLPSAFGILEIPMHVYCIAVLRRSLLHFYWKKNFFTSIALFEINYFPSKGNLGRGFWSPEGLFHLVPDISIYLVCL